MGEHDHKSFNTILKNDSRFEGAKKVMVNYTFNVVDRRFNEEQSACLYLFT